MYTHGRRFRAHSILAAVSLSIACASGVASRSRPDAAVDLNAPAGSRSDMNGSGDERSSSRGVIAPSESKYYARMEDLLAARVPALDVRPLGGRRFSLRVRGRGALANAEPVVVIDGMRYTKNGADMLFSLVPRWVKRIEVLTDAASTAGIVGAGTSGAIVVTTWRY